jgi:hypothetical protein
MMTCRLRLLDCWARNQPSGRCDNQIACGNGHERAKKQGLAATKRLSLKGAHVHTSAARVHPQAERFQGLVPIGE